MVELIDYNLFKSKFWRPEEGRVHNVVFKIPGRSEEREYEGKRTPRMVFDVIMADGETFALGQKEFVSSSAGFAEQMEVIEKEALAAEKLSVALRFRYEKKRYDLRLFQG